MLSTTIFLGVVGLDCWLFWRVIFGGRPGRPEATQLTGLEEVFAALLAAVIATSWAGLVLAELGVFSLGRLSAILVAIGLALAVWASHKRIALRPLRGFRVDRYDVGAAVLAVLVAVLYARPGEHVVGGWDPGVYVNTGVSIARTGGIVITDSALGGVDQEDWAPLLYGEGNPPLHYGVRMPGFVVRDVESAAVLPQFFHVLPVWVAVLYEIGGTHLALLATPLFGWLSVVALYLLGRRLIHPGAGLLAMGLLAINISQVWFARNAFADIIVQFWLLSGFWILAVFVHSLDNNRGLAIAAAMIGGACFGFSHLVKLDAFVGPPVVLGFVVYCWLTGGAGRAHACFLAIYLILCVHTILHGYFFCLPYVCDVLGLFGVYIRIGLVVLASAVPLLLLVFWQRKRLARAAGRLSRHRAWLNGALVALVLFAGVYAYFVRPLQADLGGMDEEELAKQGEVIALLHPIALEPQTRSSRGQEVRTYVEEGILRMGWYLTPLGVWLGIAGFLYWATDRLTLSSAPLLLGALVNSVLVFYRGAIVSQFFWAFKRYVPLVVPSFILFIAFLVRELWPKQHSRWLQGIVPITIIVFLGFSYLSGSVMFWAHVEWEGVVDDVAELAAGLHENGVVLFQRSTPSIILSTPLTYVHDVEAFLLKGGAENDARLQEAVDRWHREGRAVYWIVSSSGAAPDSLGAVALVDEYDLSWPHVPELLDKLPDSISSIPARVSVYLVLDEDGGPDHYLDVSLGNEVTLVGYDLEDTEVRSGGKLYLTLYWRARESMNTDYTVFTHLIGDDGTIWGQRDSQPASGWRPTSGWAAGETVSDPIVIPVKPEAPQGVYRLQAGLYDLATMERLPVLGEGGEPVGDVVLLETIRVE
jgi:hypothetical protein